MPDPGAVIKFQMPHPRDLNVSKCPTNARGGMGTAGMTGALQFSPLYSDNKIALERYTWKGEEVVN